MYILKNFAIQIRKLQPPTFGYQKADFAELNKQRKKLHIWLTRAQKFAKSVIDGFSDFDLVEKLWPIKCRFRRKFMFN